MQRNVWDIWYLYNFMSGFLYTKYVLENRIALTFHKLPKHTSFKDNRMTCVDQQKERELSHECGWSEVKGWEVISSSNLACRQRLAYLMVTSKLMPVHITECCWWYGTYFLNSRQARDFASPWTQHCNLIAAEHTRARLLHLHLASVEDTHTERHLTC